MNTPDNLDPFEAFFRQELENQEPGVPDFHWRRIESAIREEEDEQAAIIWLWRLLGLELAACLLLVWIAPQMHPIHHQEQKISSKPAAEIIAETNQNKSVSTQNGAPSVANRRQKPSHNLRESGLNNIADEYMDTSIPLADATLYEEEQKTPADEVFGSNPRNVNEPKSEQENTPLTLKPLNPSPTTFLTIPLRNENQHCPLPLMENRLRTNWSWGLDGGISMNGFRFAPSVDDEILLSRFSKTALFAAQRLGWSVEAKLLNELSPRLRGKISLGYQTLKKTIVYDAQDLSPDSLELIKLDQDTYQVRVFNESKTKVEDQHYDVFRLGLGLEYQYRACFSNIDLGLATNLQNPGIIGFVGLGVGIEKPWSDKSLVRLSGQFNLYLPKNDSFSSEVLQARPWTFGLNAGFRWK
jgi:hypothetical protein